jgi:hypothetical protein
MLYGILALAWGASLTAAQIDTPPRTGTASNVTISDMSPMIVYTPSSSGPAESTWNQTWAGISWANYTPKYPVIEDDNDTMPLSFHTTSFVGATAQLSFLGTAVYFYGYAHGAFEIEVGGTTTAVEIQSDEVVLLAYSEGLDNAMHDTRLILTSGEISLSAVVVTVEVGGVG